MTNTDGQPHLTRSAYLFTYAHWSTLPCTHSDTHTKMHTLTQVRNNTKMSNGTLIIMNVQYWHKFVHSS